MWYRLAEGVSFCRLDDMVVVLDLARDRYRALRGPAAQALFALADQPLSTDTPNPWIAVLIRHGIVCASSEPCTVRPCEARPAAVGPPVGASPALPDICLILATIVITTFILRAKSLQNVLLSSGGKSPTRMDPRPATARKLEDLVRAFTAVDMYMKRSERCLPRSIALARYLRSNGYTSAILFGVAVNPFRAHCWVECDGLVLNDEPDHIRNFVPIKVVTW